MILEFVYPPSMGNCCPCVKSEANTRSSVAPGNYPLSPGKLEESGTNALFVCLVLVYHICCLPRFIKPLSPGGIGGF